MYVERDVGPKFGLAAANYPVVAVVGPRQAGKTTFLRERAKTGNASYVTFDDPDVRELFDSDVKKFESQYLEGVRVAVLDEVQYGAGAGRKIKYLADRGKKLWVTSSSQILLGKEVLSWLVGRVSVLSLYPFSFPEFLRAKGQAALTPTIRKRSIWEHAVYGGYPKVVSSEGNELKTMLLRDLYSTMVLKDIARTFSIEDVGALEAFTKYLCHSIGGPVVNDKVSSELGISVATVKKYFNAAEKSYLVARIPPFYSNKLKEITKQPKVYFMDTGLRNAVANRFPLTLDNEGKLFENYVLTELLKLGASVKYWQTKSKAEVDFVIERNGETIPLEVKLYATPEKTGKSMRSFIQAYKPKKAAVIYYEGTPGATETDGCKIQFADATQLKNVIGE